MASRTVLFTCVVLFVIGKREVNGDNKNLVDSFSDYLGDPDMSIIPPTKIIPLYDCTDSHRPKFGDATQFQVYHNDQWWTQACPDGLEWNQYKCRCGYADGSEPTVACRDYRQNSEGLVGKYEQFVNGKWIVRDCSLSVAGLVWDQTTCQCVWGPDSSGKVNSQKITPCDVMLNMTFEDGVKDYAKGSFVEVGRGKPVSIEAIDTKGKSGNMAAYFTNTALNLWFFSNNELGSSLRLEMTFLMEDDPSTRDSYQMLVSNGCNVSMPGYTTPSLAIGYRPSDQSYLLAFETVTARKAIVCSQKLGAYDWHTVSLIYEDGTLLLRVDGRPCIMSQDFSGHVQKTSCPLTIGADPLERDSMYQGYIDDIIIARYCRRYVDKDDIDNSGNFMDVSNPATHNEGPMLVEPASRVSKGGERWSGRRAEARHRSQKTRVQRRQKPVEYADEEDKQDNTGDMDTGDADSYSEEYDYNEKDGQSKGDDYGAKDYYDDDDEEGRGEYEDGGKKSAAVESEKRRTNVKGYVEYEEEKSSENDQFDQGTQFGRRKDIGAWRKSGGGGKWWEQTDEDDEGSNDNKGESWRGFDGKDSGRVEKRTGFDKEGRKDKKQVDSWDSSRQDRNDDQGSKDQIWPKQTKRGGGERQDYGRKLTELDKEDNSGGDRMFEESSNEAKSTEYKEFNRDFYPEGSKEGQEYTDFTDYGDDYSKEGDFSDSSENSKWKDESKVYTDYDYKDQKAKESGEDYPDTSPPKDRIPDAEMPMGNEEGGDYKDYGSRMVDDEDDDGWGKRSGQRGKDYEYAEDEDSTGKADLVPAKTGGLDERRRESGHMRSGDSMRMDRDKVRRRMRDRRGKAMQEGRDGSENDRMSDSRMGQRRRGFNNRRRGFEGMHRPGKGGRWSDAHRQGLGDREGRRSREGHFTNRMGHDSRGSQRSMRHPSSNLMDLSLRNSGKEGRAPPEKKPYDGKAYERNHQGQERSARDRSRRNRRGPGHRWEGGNRWAQRQKQGRPMDGGNAMNVHNNLMD